MFVEIVSTQLVISSKEASGNQSGEDDFCVTDATARVFLMADGFEYVVNHAIQCHNRPNHLRPLRFFFLWRGFYSLCLPSYLTSNSG